MATASAAGASYHTGLVWALAFATVACMVLQEMAARITIASGKEILNILDSKKVKLLIAISVLVGCAAYEAGNILGAIAGLNLLIDVPVFLSVSVLVIICALILWFGSVQTVSRFLGVFVAVMGLVFCVVAFNVDLEEGAIAQGLIPSVPAGSEWIVIGLIGTTIVPYNLFLGSGISKGQQIPDMRFGLVVSVLLGGVVSVAILVAGIEINDVVSFAELASVTGEHLGAWAKIFMALGLLCAGLTSSVTAPLAAALIMKNVGGTDRAYKWGWILVLITGFIFGITALKPIPIIIMAQALNGMILPLVTIFLIIKANDLNVMTAKCLNGWLINVLSVLILDVVLIIGINNIYKTCCTAFHIQANRDLSTLIFLQLIGAPVLLFTVLRVLKLRKVKNY
ncbi:divalent metal cation transporter [Fulvivirga maritima]|uniref:NRAMP family divalent metal transporter n=1 Tax=Fulvivirga maritima TaxID=2904247 RepID=UPI001F1F36E8|nr:divalent metal cation transporter [Fulvivirga maritima]UII28653.1 divalent metal cation transporter [Fulvivirga maritima]